ncbi:MAG: hypothetical protein FWD98_04110 [Defluviitaleaceae bacterium]|nr:hypothetical protein [Defluviitaleaceae bacterium]
MLDKLQIFVSIGATIVASLISIYQDVTLDTLAFRLLTVIVVFYVVGLAARIYLKRYVFFKPPEEEAEEAEADAAAADIGENMGGSDIFENFTTDEAGAAARSKYD